MKWPGIEHGKPERSSRVGGLAFLGFTAAAMATLFLSIYLACALLLGWIVFRPPE